MYPPDSKMTLSLRQYLRSETFRLEVDQFSDEVKEKVLRYGAPLGSFIEVHETLPRCMGRLREMIASSRHDSSSLPSGAVVIAKQLQDGCGRFDREWFAPAGGFWMAVAWADTLLPEFTRLFPLAAGTAGCEAVRAFGVDAAVKWVNDIQAGGRKIGGVLCETTPGLHQEDRYHLIGIGINCNNISFPEELKASATSMRRELQADIDLEHFSLELLARLAWNFGLIHLYEEQSLAMDGSGQGENLVNPVVTAWKALSDTPGRRVIYGYDVVRKPLYRARAVDVDSTGALVMQLDDGSIVTENSGEIIYLPD